RADPFGLRSRVMAGDRQREERSGHSRDGQLGQTHGHRLLLSMLAVGARDTSVRSPPPQDNSQSLDQGCVMLSAADVIRLLHLEPHPEGGHFVQTFRDAATVNDRPVSTAIYYLLARGERGHWHKVDAAEVWHYYAGAPLALEMAASERGP